MTGLDRGLVLYTFALSQLPILQAAKSDCGYYRDLNFNSLLFLSFGLA